MPNIRRKLCILTIILGLLYPCVLQAAACLGYGSRGHDVVVLQQRLQELNYNVGAIDGEFGRQTRRAVEQFQQEQGLRKTGFVDNDTWRKLSAAKHHYYTPPSTPKRYQPQAFAYSASTDKIVADAEHYLGTPYVWGGQDPKGFDCSGFVQYIFANNGITLPRTADLQYAKGLPVRKENLQKGDVVFFTTYTAGPSHDGIYMGDGKFISATTSRGIAVDNLDESYWKARYVGAKRLSAM